MNRLKVSRRQAEVVSLVAHGYSDKEIAGQLGLSLGTVKTYLGRLYRENGFRNRAEAAAACVGQTFSVNEVDGPRLEPEARILQLPHASDNRTSAQS